VRRKELRAENFPYLGKNMDIHVQRDYRASNKHD
jgi:hypothetical protein